MTRQIFSQHDTYCSPQIPVITSLPVSSDVFLDEETDEETQLHTLVYTDDQPLDKVTCRMTVAPPTTAIVLKRILDKSGNRKGIGYVFKEGYTFKIVWIPFEKGSILKGKNLLPSGANSFF